MKYAFSSFWEMAVVVAVAFAKRIHTKMLHYHTKLTGVHDARVHDFHLHRGRKSIIADLISLGVGVATLVHGIDNHLCHSTRGVGREGVNGAIQSAVFHRPLLVKQNCECDIIYKYGEREGETQFK